MRTAPFFVPAAVLGLDWRTGSATNVPTAPGTLMLHYKPAGHHDVTPYFTLHDVPGFIRFLQEAFDAKLVGRIDKPDGSVAHAQLTIGDSMLMMGEAPQGRKPVEMWMYLYVPDTDATYRRALEAGAISVMEPADQVYGDRNAGVKDAHGNHWWIATHKEDVPGDELVRRMRAKG